MGGRVGHNYATNTFTSFFLYWEQLNHFPGGSGGKESTCNAGDLGSIPEVEKIFWRRAWQPTPVFLPGGSPWTGVWQGYSPRGRKESDTTERLTPTDLAFDSEHCWLILFPHVFLSWELLEARRGTLMSVTAVSFQVPYAVSPCNCPFSNRGIFFVSLLLCCIWIWLHKW